ncbi:helix-turn-helix transcriptional regulator [Microlunatus elymi]|uniref:Helix-turn-helix transcriptional regulator n=1 Tax=Microlunatus elymi TaxID=2596828 RepID=A0A516PZH9_9ACTN|nr:AraC family transcriptional regulator [Microlunatus elymi]QDP96574.1 helix-turn-helix transcriptional regulator [Microlunatus elymi]
MDLPGRDDTDVPRVWLDLSEPPVVVNQGRGSHGVRSLVDEFQLPQLWSLHLYGYHATLEVAAHSYQIAPGTVSLVPPVERIRYVYRGPSKHLYAHFRPAVGRDTSLDHKEELALIMSPGAELPMITDLMESAVAAAPVSPARTRADIWSVLLRLADRSLLPRASRPSRDHLRVALSHIESRLPEPVSVPEVAAAAGISPGHLARVFAAEMNETVVGYIRRRRIEHARRLLASSTMSIGAIAVSVGYPDLQAFNKACRRVTGRSPRQLRDG